MARKLNLRQSIRKFIVIILFLLFPVTFFYLSPVLPIEAQLFDGIINGSMIMFIVLFFLSLLFGRIWCGWICPGAGMEEIVLLVSNNKAKNGKTNWIKWFLWFPWLIFVLSLLFTKLYKHEIKKIDFFHMTNHGASGVHLVDFNDRIVPFIIYYSVLVLFFILPLIFGKRALCHYICWMSPFMIIGRKIRNILKWPSLKLSSNKKNCINCKL